MNLVTRTDANKSRAALGTGAGADGVIGTGEGATGGMSAKAAGGMGAGAAGGMGAGVAGVDGARGVRTRSNSLPMSNALSDDVIVERSLTKTLGEKTSTVAEHSASLKKSRSKSLEPERRPPRKVTFKDTESLNDDTLGEDINKFKYLIGRTHRDNEDYQRYVTVKVYVDKRSGNIVGERTLLLKVGSRHKALDPSPIYIKN